MCLQRLYAFGPRQSCASIKCVQAIDIEDNGRVLGCYLCHVEREVDSGRLRNEALSSYSPIHRWHICCSWSSA